MLALSDFTAGNIKLFEVLIANTDTYFHNFTDFLKVLEVYGCGYWNDVDKERKK